MQFVVLFIRIRISVAAFILVGFETIVACCLIFSLFLTIEDGLKAKVDYGKDLKDLSTIQVEVVVNGIPSKCAANYDGNNQTSCQFDWSESSTPTVTGLGIVSSRKKRSAGTVTAASGDQIEITGKHRRKFQVQNFQCLCCMEEICLHKRNVSSLRNGEILSLTTKNTYLKGD